MRPASISRALASAGLVVALVCAPASRASAAPSGASGAAPSKDEASERFRAGVAFYKDRDFAAALVEFKRAYELSPNYRVLYNLGQCSQELKDYATALGAFERYVREGGKEIDKKRKLEVDAVIVELAKKVARLTIEVSVEGAEVVLDDVSLGTSPLAEPALVNAGRRRFTITADGHETLQRVVDVAGADARTLRFDLVKRAANTAPTVVVAPAPPPERTTPLAPWIALGVTGATAIGTGVMGGLALSARGELDGALAKFPGDRAAIADAQSRTQGFAIGADVLGAFTIAGAVTTTVLFVLASSSDDEAASKERRIDPELEPGPSARLVVGPSGAWLEGTF
jgi:tetratricopeptide (TPR) repeat protein